MRILLTGQCTLHWGRMEYGNIGNYYIIEPFIRSLHSTFPGCEVITTFQMSDRFCRDENIKVLPMNLYYGWDNDLVKSMEELDIAKRYLIDGKTRKTTPFIDIVKNSDLVIDYSGDIWGDNANLLGKDRFIVGLCKDRTAQIFAPRTVMIAGSPGPIENQYLEFAKEVYANFDFVTNRENISTTLLEDYGFDTSRTYSLACPAFLFEPSLQTNIGYCPQISNLLESTRPKIGFVICGWNFTEGPFDKWPRNDNDYVIYAEAIEEFLKRVDADIYLLSHSNGFPIPPIKFELLHGRDYFIVKQLQKVLNDRGNAKNIFSLDEVYDAWQTKSVIGLFDMFVSGRVHAAVSALSQSIPTVIIDYGHEPKAHKLKGFAEVTNTLEYVASPNSSEIFEKMMNAWTNRDLYKKQLSQQIPEVKKKAIANFALLKTLF